jgi:hypothetical protein
MIYPIPISCRIQRGPSPKNTAGHSCRWQSFPTIPAVFGTNIHPDLAKLQCEQGALYSYREAERNLEKANGHQRGVNNHTQVKRMTNKVGAYLAEENRRLPSAEECAAPAQDVLIQVDGGHIDQRAGTQLWR